MGPSLAHKRADGDEQEFPLMGIFQLKLIVPLLLLKISLKSDPTTLMTSALMSLSHRHPETQSQENGKSQALLKCAFSNYLFQHCRSGCTSPVLTHAGFISSQLNKV